ncbi:MAG: hypothetical protein MJK12_18910 [Colwellia sp.]|nr:hypothetical protein [Colwellia sp.]
MEFIYSKVLITALFLCVVGCDSNDKKRDEVFQKIALSNQKYEQNKIHLPDKYISKTKKGAGTFFQSNYVWAYTSKFAKRFDMPDQFIDDSLNGASAIAFTVQNLNSERCRFAGGKDNCSQVSQCYFDFYIDDTINLPWKNEQTSGFARTSNLSYYYLQNSKPSINNENSIDWNIEKNKRDLDYRKLAFDVTLWSYTSPRKYARVDAYLTQFKRPLLKGLNYFRVNSNCGAPVKPNNIMQFAPINPLNLDFNDPESHKIYIPDSISEFLIEYNRAKQAIKYQ